ncbi:phosphohexomutase domain-containing protein [Haloplanus aerogenes]|uniref:Phosphomannomutase n=1 Tax=Haloplanus aerogenes TaxID=660522 RepID=A0A3M0DU79_9EURY|nr:phosphomannomutase [Haloplanus aerogenes]AZH25903.1 phosphomannomutase [Haloplanus aerogenes]RMB25658.1 phosphomannomutase [Haloplanus aerogenes]
MDLFGTAGIRGSVRTEVTPELAVAVGQAVGRDAGEVVVGRDGRTTGGALAAAVEAGVRSGGAAVRRVGVVPTPALAFASRGRYGVMLTASHNPPGDNGIKCFVDGVEYDRDRERVIEERVAADHDPVAWDVWGDGHEESVLDAYRAAVVDYARGYGAPLDDLSVAVDCGNGVGALATPAVLRDLGATVETLEGNVDGHFPGRESKPTPESLTTLRRFVADGDVAFGIGHDGDADRIVIVDGSGEVVHEDTVLAIVAERYVRASDAADPVVVTTPNASARIDERVTAAGGRVERVRLGALHEGIAAVRKEGGTVVFAAEPWKHIHPAFGGWIDAVASAAVFARHVAAEGIDGLRAPVTERPYRKVSVPCPDPAKADAMERLRTTLPEAFPEASVDTAHGVRLERPDGSWLLVRPSGTEPYVRLYAESESVDDLVTEARAVIERAVEGAS